MSSYNRTVIVGRLGFDPDLKYLQSGTAVCELNIAVSDRRKDGSGNYQEETHWIPCTFWGRTAEVLAEYVSTGDLILCEGRLKVDTWETDQGKRSKMKVVVEKMQMLSTKGKKGSGGGGGQQRSQGPPPGAASQQGPPPGAAAPPPDDEIPF